MEDSSFEETGKPVAEANTFVLVNSVGAARRLEVSRKGAVGTRVVKTVLQLGCASQDAEPSELPRSVK